MCPGCSLLLPLSALWVDLLFPVILWCHHEHPDACGGMCLSVGCRLRWHSLSNLLCSPNPTFYTLPSCLHLRLPSWLGLTFPQTLEAACRTLSVFLQDSPYKERPHSNAATKTFKGMLQSKHDSGFPLQVHPWYHLHGPSGPQLVLIPK